MTALSSLHAKIEFHKALQDAYYDLFRGVKRKVIETQWLARWRDERPDGYEPIAGPYLPDELKLLLSHVRSLEGFGSPRSPGQEAKDYVFWPEGKGICTGHVAPNRSGSFYYTKL